MAACCATEAECGEERRRDAVTMFFLIEKMHAKNTDSECKGLYCLIFSVHLQVLSQCAVWGCVRWGE